MEVASENLANSELGEPGEEVITEEIVVKDRKVKFNESAPVEPVSTVFIPISFSRTEDHFQQWLNRQKEKDRIAAREKYISNRVETIEDEARQQRRERAKATFEMWKQKKELEAIERNSLKQDIQRINGLLKKETKKAETLPGYISTWASDTPLVMKMQKQCPRAKQF